MKPWAAFGLNLGIIILPNAIAIFLGAFGFIGPPMAAIINNGATFLAVAVGTIPLPLEEARSLTSQPVLQETNAGALLEP